MARNRISIPTVDPDERPRRGLSTASMTELLDRVGAPADVPDAPLWAEGVDPDVWSRAAHAYRLGLIGAGPLAGYADIGFDDCVGLLDAAGVDVAPIPRSMRVPAGTV